MVDLLSRAATADAVLELIDPSTDPREPLLDESGKQVTISFHGLDSPAFRAASRAQADVAQKRLKSGDESFEQQVDAGARWLASITKGWSDSISLGGAPLPYSADNALKLYREVHWVTEQASEFVRRMGLRQTFTKASAAR